MARIPPPRVKPKAKRINPLLWLIPVLVLAMAGMMWLMLQSGEQTADTRWRPEVGRPTFASGNNPVVCVDEAHRNFHTVAGRYAPFALLLEADGFTVRPFRQTVRGSVLSGCRILVIANAQETLEAPALETWVREGGSLLLIADHTPYAEAAESTAAAFGFRTTKGFVADPRGEEDVFLKSDGTLASHPTTEGVDRVRTFLGQAIAAPVDATPILLLGKGYRAWKTRAAFDQRKPEDSESVAGLCQLAVKQHGHGRVAIAGEAAMFTAQIDPGPMRRPMGMNAPGAEQNVRFVLNLMRWLAAAH